MLFRKTRARIQTTISLLRDSFTLLVLTLHNLTSTIESNSASVAALKDEQRELRLKLDKLVEHSRFLAAAKRSELQRQGQPHQL